MNKNFQLEQLHRMLTNPSLKSGLYLIDTDLDDEEIGLYVKEKEKIAYYRGSLMGTKDCTGFEWFIIKLSFDCESDEIKDLRNSFLGEKIKSRDTMLLGLLVLIMRKLGADKRTVIHVSSQFDIASLSHEDLSKLNEAIIDSRNPVVIINKKRTTDPLITTLSLKGTKRTDIKMERTEVLHILYKHDTAYEEALKSIQTGLEKNGIPYSINEYDIMYRDNFDDYERETGASGMVIMFVVPSYLKSLDCMFEMTQMFKNGNVRNRIFPIVDMGGIPRNSDGLKLIKDYWQGEKERKAEQIKAEPGGSSFVIKEIEKIDGIIVTLNEFWFFISRTSTGKYEQMIDNDAALLIEEINKTQPTMKDKIDGLFVPTDDTQPAGFRTVVQNGEKSVYVENNMGTINVN